MYHCPLYTFIYSRKKNSHDIGNVSYCTNKYDKLTRVNYISVKQKHDNQNKNVDRKQKLVISWKILKITLAG